MSRLTAQELQLSIENVILRRLRSLRVARPKAVAEEITMDIMRDSIPSEAYDLKSCWEYGCLFFHQDIDQESVLEAQKELLGMHYNLKAGTPITLFLSSFGGETFAGLSLVSTIAEVRRMGRQVNAHIMGCAMSMGSLVAQACDVRTIEPAGYFMIHEMSWDPGYQKTHLHRDDIESNERIESTLWALYSARTGKPTSYYKEKMHRKDWYLTAREAVSECLVDRIRPTPAFKGKRIGQQQPAATKKTTE